MAILLYRKCKQKWIPFLKVIKQKPDASFIASVLLRKQKKITRQQTNIYTYQPLPSINASLQK